MARSRPRSSVAGWLTPLRLAFALALVFSVLRLDNWRYLHLSDIRAMDYRLLHRGTVEPTGDVVIVAIDDASIAALGRWPWPRSVFARLLDRIQASEPLAVGIDIAFSEPSPFRDDVAVSARPRATDGETWDRTQATLALQDVELGDSLRRSSKTVLGYYFDELSRGTAGATKEFDAAALPSAAGRYAVFQAPGAEAGLRHVLRADSVQATVEVIAAATTAMGYFNIEPDRGDGLVRRLPLTIRHGDAFAQPLALVTLQAARDLGAAHLRLDRYGVVSLTLAGREIPVAEDGSLVVQYRGPAYTFDHVSAVDLLTDDATRERLRNKIVLVGVTAVAVADFRATPFSAVFPGVEIHANVIDNFIRGDFLYQPRWLVGVDILVLLLIAAVMGVGLRRLRGVAGLLAAVALLAIYAAGSQVAYLRLGLPLSIVYPMLTVFFSYTAIVLTQYVTEERERRRLRRVMDLYLSPTMAEHVSAHPERLSLGGEKLELTVFFSDIRGFTTISEQLAPEALVDLLNHYLGAMTDIIFDRDGMLDKYIGDAVMAVWGAPLPQPDHARRACLAAVAMTERLQQINAEGSARGWPRLEIGCGLNTGPVVFGNMGSEQHLALTVMGDNVNLASRLEGTNKFYGTQILATDATIRAAGDAIVTREIDLVRVKGRRAPVAIFEILGRAETRDDHAALVTAFAAGLAAYRERRWEDAEKAFRAVLAVCRDDRPSRLYLERCALLRAQDPGLDWDPVTTLDSK